MDSYTSEDARREWRRILDKVQRGEQVGITRYGDPLAVVVPAEWYAEAEARTLSPEDQETVRRALGFATAWIEAGNGDPATVPVYKSLLARLIHSALAGGRQ